MTAALHLDHRLGVLPARPRARPVPASLPALPFSSAAALWLSLPALLPLLLMPERATPSTLAQALAAVAALLLGSLVLSPTTAPTHKWARPLLALAFAGVLLAAVHLDRAAHLEHAAWLAGGGPLVMALAVGVATLSRRAGATSPLLAAGLAAVAAGLAVELGTVVLGASRSVLLILFVMAAVLAVDLAHRRRDVRCQVPRSARRPTLRADFVLGAAAIIAVAAQLALAGPAFTPLTTLTGVAFAGLGFLRLWQLALSPGSTKCGLAGDPWLFACLVGWALAAGSLLPPSTLSIA